jgi:PadR family transcriptional regulator, regulatory protein PadR
VEFWAVTPRSGFSAQTLSVLAALSSQPSQWQHGYALAQQTNLKSGTLYPILIRLADRGLVESEWQEEPAPGRPRRHLYRLTTDGLAAAAAARANSDTVTAAKNDAARPSGRQPRARTGRPGLSGTGLTAQGSAARNLASARAQCDAEPEPRGCRLRCLSLAGCAAAISARHRAPLPGLAGATPFPSWDQPVRSGH